MRLLSYGSEGRAGRALRRAWIVLLLGSSPGLLSCGGDTGVTDPTDPNPVPDPVPEAELIFLKARADAPTLLTSDTSFVATRGEEIKVEIERAGSPPLMPLPAQRLFDLLQSLQQLRRTYRAML